MPEVSSGLSRVLTATDVATGYLELQGGWTQQSGGYGRLEGGYRPLENLGLFGYSQVDKWGPQVGAGIRLNF